MLLYEAEPAHGMSVEFYIICTVFVILLALGILICVKYPKGKIIDMIFPFIADTVILIIIIIQIINVIGAKHNVYEKYIKGEYEVTEGVISEYFSTYGIGDEILYDHFEVNDIFFNIPGYTTPWGYPLRIIDGGVLKNGLYVKIFYIFYKCEYVIMHIELVEN